MSANGQPSRIELIVGRPMRIALAATAITLAVGLVLQMAGLSAGARIVAAGLVALPSMPVAILAAILVLAVRLREWRFVLATITVLLLLVATLIWSGR